ncbi:MAG: 2-C-methyl-D-erythritol 4-phosphate cytidylyltransferase [Lachnospiraceae bacterium]|nr:2-C-methyl-D-erythritol 4-phosphate cytidylyltransferase [Lachnospiraceae bacterium]
MKNVAIVLAGGSGSRMKSKVKKQYMMLGNRPVLWYSLRVFQENPNIDEIVLVCGTGEEEQCRREFVETYGFSKIQKITAGGKERYNSVYEGLKEVGACDYVLIHDGARPFINHKMLERIFACLADCPACVVGMPVKETIKIRNADCFVEQTLPRDRLWTVQTPQSFSCSLIRQAYDKLMSFYQFDAELRQERRKQSIETEKTRTQPITDDAMVVETIMNIPVKLIEGSYDNIKITTPEDLAVAEMLLARITD